MSLFYVEKQCWQRWPRVVLMCRKTGFGGHDTKRYVPEKTCTMRKRPWNQDGFHCDNCGHEDLTFKEWMYDTGNRRFCCFCGARIKGVEEE